MGTEAAMDIRGVSYSIDGVPILRSVDLRIADGEFLAIVGPNGAGKTTLLTCLAGIRRCTAGDILLFGKPLGAFTGKERAKLTGYVPQADGRPIPFTVEEFLLMGRHPYLSPFSVIGPKDRRAVAAALDLTGITRLASRRVDTLSGGERQIAAVAAVVAQGCRVMLLDEPTAYLDPGHARSLYILLSRLNHDQGITVAVVTHDINAAALAADRIAVLADGTCVHTGTPAETMTSAVLEPVYNVPLTFFPHPVTGIPIVLPEVGAP